jgi:hypothetical protein
MRKFLPRLLQRVNVVPVGQQRILHCAALLAGQLVQA